MVVARRYASGIPVDNGGGNVERHRPCENLLNILNRPDDQFANDPLRSGMGEKIGNPSHCAVVERSSGNKDAPGKSLPCPAQALSRAIERRPPREPAQGASAVMPGLTPVKIATAQT